MLIWNLCNLHFIPATFYGQSNLRTRAETSSQCIGLGSIRFIQCKSVSNATRNTGNKISRRHKAMVVSHSTTGQVVRVF